MGLLIPLSLGLADCCICACNYALIFIFICCMKCVMKTTWLNHNKFTMNKFIAVQAFFLTTAFSASHLFVHNYSKMLMLFIDSLSSTLHPCVGCNIPALPISLFWYKYILKSQALIFYLCEARMCELPWNWWVDSVKGQTLLSVTVLRKELRWYRQRMTWTEHLFRKSLYL